MRGVLLFFYCAGVWCQRGNRAASSDPSHTPSPSPTSAPNCIDTPDWEDDDGETCARYESKEYCTIQGDHGDGWKTFWGVISDFSVNGIDGFQACCACGGGSSNAEEIPDVNEVYPPLKYEWIVYLVNGYNFCSGTVISENWVLTAAHCVCGLYELPVYECTSESKYTDAPINVLGFLYVHNRRNFADTHLVSFDAFEIHPGFDSVTYIYDVALLRTTETLPVRPIEFGSDDDSEIGTSVTALGWGSKSSDTTDYSDVLMETNVEILDADDTDWQGLREHQIPAGKIAGNTFTTICKGYYGGPIFVGAETRSPKLVGVVSFGHNSGSCGNPEFPTVAVDVTHSEIMAFITDFTA